MHEPWLCVLPGSSVARIPSFLPFFVLPSFHSSSIQHKWESIGIGNPQSTDLDAAEASSKKKLLLLSVPNSTQWMQMSFNFEHPVSVLEIPLLNRRFTSQIMFLNTNVIQIMVVVKDEIATIKPLRHQLKQSAQTLFESQLLRA